MLSIASRELAERSSKPSPISLGAGVVMACGLQLNPTTLPHLPVCLDFKNGKLYANDRPGLGVELDMKQLKQIAEITERATNRAQTYFRPDGSITNW